VAIRIEKSKTACTLFAQVVLIEMNV
jgi:hypothetical protein